MIISNYAIKFRSAVFVFIAVSVILGVSSYRNLPREGAPDITIPYVFVAAVYEGTAPSEMEKLVTIPLEKQLNDLENVKEMRSTTAEGICSVAIEFLAGQDINTARQRVKDQIDLARPNLPRDLDEPIVNAFNFSSDFPVFILTLSGPTDLQRLKALAETVKTDIELVPGVKDVGISGVREREIRVEIDLARVAAYGLPLGLVVQRIADENRTISAGNIDTGNGKFQVRMPGEFGLASELKDLLLVNRPGGAVYLSDVASVADTFKDARSLSRLNGDPCVSISVKKRSGVNTVEVAGSIRKLIDHVSMPPEISMTVVFDQADHIHMMINELENNIFSGFVLVVGVLLFMGWRNSLLVAVAIPLSMLISFVVMGFMGMTLNMIVLFSLVMAVGMLGDNAIVIVENTYRQHCDGLSRIDAARRGAGEVAWPVITSTLTTVAAFWPLLTWPGIMGQFMGFLPKTLMVTLLSSLFVALVMNPALCSALVSRPKGGKTGAARGGNPLMKGYESFLRGALSRRGAVVVLSLLAMILTVQTYARYGKGIELFPEVEPRNATVDVKFPQGMAIERTDAAIREIESKLQKYEDIKFFLTTVGGQDATALMGETGTHIGQIRLEFKDAAERKQNSMKTVSEIRKDVGLIPGAEVKVDKEEEGPPTGAPVSIEVTGEDFDVLSRISGDIMREISTVEGLVDLRDDFEEALPELRVHVDRDRAAVLGLDMNTVGGYLRTAIYGTESSKFRSGDEEYDITVRAPAAQRGTVDMLQNTLIPGPGGVSVPLSSVCRVAYEGGKGAITRKNQKRVITVIGENEGRGSDKVLGDVRKRLADFSLPRGYGLTYTGENKEMEESGSFLAGAFALAVGLILVILVVQFNSPIQPLIIGSSVVLSIVGVMWGLLICRMRFGIIMTGVGVISLAGVVVNNAIVLVDCVRLRRAEGLSAMEALVTAGCLRMRPVLLTAITTILGLIPMAIGYSLEIHEWPPLITAGAESSAWWAPMAVAVIFGLGVATMLTLVVVPVLYSLCSSGADRLRALVRR
jgi:CzcA family heavy metal efflux pump